MRDTLESKIKNIKERLEAKDPTAFEDARQLAEIFPDEPKVWHTLAYAYEWKGDHKGAIIAITREMDIRPGRPALFFTRGGYKLMMGDYRSAIDDFGQGLVQCDELKNEAYREVLHFLRAEAFVQLGRKAEARADLDHVADDCVFWTIQVRSKAELLALCADSFAEGGPMPSPMNKDIPSESSDVGKNGGNGLVDDSEEVPESPDEAELALVAELGAAGLAAIDANLLKAASHQWRKAARVVGSAADAGGFVLEGETCVRVHARRLIALVESGKLEAQGDLFWLRYSEVRFPPSG